MNDIFNTSTPYSIRKLTINKKENLHRSRNRLGFHVYISRFFYDFNKMSLAQQHQYIFYNDKVRLGRHRIINNRDDISIDSTSSCLTEKVPRATIYRSACKNWRYNVTIQLKKAWKSRASNLNNRKLPGKFLHIPFSLERRNSIESRVLQSLTYEWDTVVRFFKNCITRDPRKSTSSMVYTFGKEKVPVLSQTYREFRFSFLMEKTLFGDNLSI